MTTSGHRTHEPSLNTFCVCYLRPFSLLSTNLFPQLIPSIRISGAIKEEMAEKCTGRILTVKKHVDQVIRHLFLVSCLFGELVDKDLAASFRVLLLRKSLADQTVLIIANKGAWLPACLTLDEI